MIGQNVGHPTANYFKDRPKVNVYQTEYHPKLGRDTGSNPVRAIIGIIKMQLLIPPESKEAFKKFMHWSEEEYHKNIFTIPIFIYELNN